MIECVSKFQHKYRIIIRSHNIESQKIVLNNLLKINNAFNIELVDTRSSTFERIVNISDVFINFWVSTTFYEECMSKSDIFVFDDSDLTNETKGIINNRAFWFDDLQDCTKSITKYLEDGLFYQKCDDETFLQKYMDWDKKDQIPKHSLNIIEDIAR